MDGPGLLGGASQPSWRKPGPPTKQTNATAQPLSSVQHRGGTATELKLSAKDKKKRAKPAGGGGGSSRRQNRTGLAAAGKQDRSDRSDIAMRPGSMGRPGSRLRMGGTRTALTLTPGGGGNEGGDFSFAADLTTAHDAIDASEAEASYYRGMSRGFSRGTGALYEWVETDAIRGVGTPGLVGTPGAGASRESLAASPVSILTTAGGNSHGQGGRRSRGSSPSPSPSPRFSPSRRRRRQRGTPQPGEKQSGTLTEGPTHGAIHIVLPREKLWRLRESDKAARRRSERHTLESYWNQIDADESGRLELNELSTLIVKLGQELSQKQVQAAMEEIDFDGSGHVSFGEFEAWWSKRSGSLQADGGGGGGGGGSASTRRGDNDLLARGAVLHPTKGPCNFKTAVGGKKTGGGHHRPS